MPSKRVVVTSADVAANIRADWNAFIDLLATSTYEDLGPLQRPAHLVFWYESEVQNGGHLQYFVNGTAGRAHETIVSLDALGASAQARILEKALATWNAWARLHPADSLEYSHIAGEGEFDDLDRAFHDSPDPLVKILERHLSIHEKEYIVRE